MDVLNQALYLVSSALLGPVMVLLLLLLAWTLVFLGGFVRESIERRSVRRQLDLAVAHAKTPCAQAELVELVRAAGCGLGYLFCERSKGFNDPLIRLKTLEDIESDISSSIATLSFLTRVAPMLGLMGTLIPLGPALMGLAGGNMKTLASNLVVAFTATVAGLLISGVAYGIALARRTWYARDLADIEFVFRDYLPGEV